MPENQEVEKFKLTKEQMAWAKDFGKKKQAYDMVKSKLMQQMAGTSRLRELLGTLQQGLMRTVKMAPEKKTAELEGQE